MAGIGSGLASQIGIVKESVFNTPVAVTTFTPTLTETLLTRPVFAIDYGLQAGKLIPDAARSVKVFEDAGGDVTFNVASKNFGRWLQASMGSSPTATQIGSTGVWTQIHNVGSTDGTSWTIQKGVASVDGTVNPFTYSGCKVTAVELSCAPQGLVMFKPTIDAAQVQPTGASALGLQTASYAADQNFGFNNCTVQQFTAMTVVSGAWTPTSPVSMGVVRNISCKWGQPKKVDRAQAGSLIKAEQLMNNWQLPTGQIDIDYASNALYTLHEAGTVFGVFVSITGAIIGSAASVATINIVMPAIRLEQGSSPQTSGPDVVTVSYPYTALGDGTNGALQIVTLSTDSAV